MAKEKVARSALSLSRRLGDRVRKQMSQAKRKRQRMMRAMLARCLAPDVSSEMEG